MSKDAEFEAVVIGAERMEKIAYREEFVAGGVPGRSPRRMTKRERRHWRHAVDVRRRIEEDIHEFLSPEGIPEAWSEIWEDRDRRDAKRTRVTVSLDADVVRFFKAMGPGYQPRMNRVLRAFMELRLCGLVAGPDANRYVDAPSLVLAENLRREKEWGENPDEDMEDAPWGNRAEDGGTGAGG